MANLPIRDQKAKILALIENVKVFCFNYPTLPINFSIPSFKNDFDVIAFLMDLIISLLGMKAKELQREVTKWLIKNIKPKINRITMKNSILISIVLFLIIGISNNSCTQKTELSSEQAKELAKDAFLFGLPAILIDIQFDFNSYVTQPEGTKAPVNQFAHFREFVDASNRSIVGFNVDNLYSLASLDLISEPVILSMPDMGDRYWIMQLIDAWNGVPAAPGSRTHGGKAANYVIVGDRKSVV